MDKSQAEAKGETTDSEKRSWTPLKQTDKNSLLLNLSEEDVAVEVERESH